MITNFNNLVDEELIKKNIILIEKNYNVKVLFGAIVNSFAKGLNNNSSDLDFQFVFESMNDCLHKTGRICYFDEKLELSGAEISLVLSEVENYRKHNPVLPSYYKNMGSTIFARHTFVFRILSSDYIYGSDYIHANSDVLYQSFKIDNALDYFFSRAKYAEQNEIIREKVKVRQYLYILHDICSMLWILERATIPPMKLDKLLEPYVSADIMKEVSLLQQLNKTNIDRKDESVRTKELILTEHISSVDDFISNKMNLIEVQLMKFN